MKLQAPVFVFRKLPGSNVEKGLVQEEAAVGQCAKRYAKLVGAMHENPTSSVGFFWKQN